MPLNVNRLNEEETKPVGVCAYNLNIGAVDLKYETVRPYSLESKKGSKLYIILFKRLFSTTTHNSMIM
jgi:hypothetical protein